MKNTKTVLLTIVLLLIISTVLYLIYSKGGSRVSGVGLNTALQSDYDNKEFGFTFSLPESWKGYSAITAAWEGNPLGTSTKIESGPKIILRNPKWTDAQHYEDIPILVFTLAQWESYTKENFAVSAAPIQASELARNNAYVFALPPRWNYDYSQGYEEAQNIINSNPLKAYSTNEVVNGNVKCNESKNYFVIEKAVTDSVGSDILVKNKDATHQNIKCEYVVAKGDFEIKNISAEYFLAFTDNFLVLDSGTAPEPRTLIVYDLRSQKKVFTDMYAKPVTIVGDTISYLSVTAVKPTSTNCPKLKEYTSNGLGAVILSKVSVNLTTLTKKDLGAVECRATQ